MSLVRLASLGLCMTLLALFGPSCSRAGFDVIGNDRDGRGLEDRGIVDGRAKESGTVDQGAVDQGAVDQGTGDIDGLQDVPQDLAHDGAVATPDVRVDLPRDPDGSSTCKLPSLVLTSPPQGAFGAPIVLSGLNSSSSEDDPTLTADMREIYFESDRGGTPQLWRSERNSAGAPWPTPTLVPELSTYRVNTPRISADGKTLHFAGPGPGGDADIYVTTRPERGATWSAPTRDRALSSIANDTGAITFLEGKGVVFYSSREGGAGNGDLWLTLRTGLACDTWLPPVPLEGINTPGVEANPWIRRDGLALVYQGSLPGGLGRGDLFMAVRPGIYGRFGAPIELRSLNTTASDSDPWLNDEMTQIYFSSPRSGNSELYRASR